MAFTIAETAQFIFGKLLPKKISTYKSHVKQDINFYYVRNRTIYFW